MSKFGQSNPIRLEKRVKDEIGSKWFDWDHLKADSVLSSMNPAAGHVGLSALIQWNPIQSATKPNRFDPISTEPNQTDQIRFNAIELNPILSYPNGFGWIVFETEDELSQVEPTNWFRFED